MRDGKGNAAALLPIGIFLVIFLGSGIVTGDFYAMPAIVAFLIALLAAFVQHRDLGFQEKIRIISQGVGDENIITMCLIFLSAGAFSGAVTAAGGVESTVNLGLSVIPAQYCCGRVICDWLLYFGFHGDFHGNHCGPGSYRSRNQ